MYTPGAFGHSIHTGAGLASVCDRKCVLLQEASFGSIRAICVVDSVVVLKAGNFVVENPPCPPALANLELPFIFDISKCLALLVPVQSAQIVEP
jgi:hypothetical protein